LFADRGVSIELISVDDDDDQRCAMEAITGRTTVPQIFIGEHHVGGYEDLVELDEQGRLDHLIVAALGAGLPE
jgi:glutaredoxin 3